MCTFFEFHCIIFFCEFHCILGPRNCTFFPAQYQCHVLCRVGNRDVHSLTEISFGFAHCNIFETVKYYLSFLHILYHLYHLYWIALLDCVRGKRRRSQLREFLVQTCLYLGALWSTASTDIYICTFIDDHHRHNCHNCLWTYL